MKPVTADGGATDAGGAADPGAEAAGADAEGAAVPQADMTSAALASSPNRRFCIKFSSKLGFAQILPRTRPYPGAGDSHRLRVA